QRIVKFFSNVFQKIAVTLKSVVYFSFRFYPFGKCHLSELFPPRFGNISKALIIDIACSQIPGGNFSFPIESRRGISPLRSHRTVRESLPSHGSSCSLSL